VVSINFYFFLILFYFENICLAKKIKKISEHPKRTVGSLSLTTNVGRVMLLETHIIIFGLTDVNAVLFYCVYRGYI